MIVQVRCVTSFTADAFGSGDYLEFEGGRAYALPSSFVQANGDKLKPVHPLENKPVREALEIKSNNGPSKRTRKPRRAKAVAQGN